LTRGRYANAAKREDTALKTWQIAAIKTVLETLKAIAMKTLANLEHIHINGLPLAEFSGSDLAEARSVFMRLGRIKAHDVSPLSELSNNQLVIASTIFAKLLKAEMNDRGLRSI
jgi:uncharacterized membrane protein